MKIRGVSGGWAIAHPDFGKLESPHYYLPTQISEATYAPENDLKVGFKMRLSAANQICRESLEV